MKKRFLFNLIIITFLTAIFTSCEEEDPPQPNFYASQYSASDDEIVISFNDQSSDGPNSWFWTFEGGNPATSTDRNPLVSYTTPGRYSVTLTARNSEGEKTVIFDDYINIVALYNTTWTPMYFEVGGESTTVPVDGYALFAGINSTTMHFYAETSGESVGGNQVGLLFTWEDNLVFDDINTWDLFINEDYVFINVKNDGPDDFYPFIVNYGDSEYEITDNITIDNDGLWKETGYYDAWDYMEVRAYFKNDPLTYVYWIEGTHFNLLWVENQGLDLWYDGSKSTKSSMTKSKSLNKNHLKIKPTSVKR